MPIEIPPATPLEQAFAISAETHAEALANALAACRTGGEVIAIETQIANSLRHFARYHAKGSGPLPRRYGEGLAACNARYRELTEMPRR